MANTVFYSWQSDRPSPTNRTFIEDALKKSIKEISTDIEILKAERDGPLKFDKDTEGVPGTPPITDVIFKKISEARVFVPDLTLVGKTEMRKTEKVRLIPNPNVLIEYGWALCALGHSCMLPIMNTAYGDAIPENLPFNIRHLRNPITYQLLENADHEEKARVKTELIKQLVSAISLILQSHNPDLVQDALVHKPTQYTDDPSNFLKKSEALGIIGGGLSPEITLMVPNNEHLFLRVIPSHHTEKINSSSKIMALLKNDLSQPFANQACAWNHGRNEHGAFAVALDNKEVLSLVQVFRNREIWGIDAYSIDKKGLMNQNNIDFGFLPCSGLETWFIQTLSTYLPFCRDILDLALPLKFIAGATKIKGYKMIAPTGMSFNGLRFEGRVVDDHIVLQGEITDYHSDPKILLRPFFEKIWEECNLKRPDREKL